MGAPGSRDVLRRFLPLLLVGLLVGTALAVESAPVLVQRTDAGHLSADSDTNATAVFALVNLNPATDFYVSITTEDVSGWHATVSPNRFLLAARAPGDTQPRPVNVSVVFSPENAAPADATYVLNFALVNTQTGESTSIVQKVDIASSAAPRVLGLFANPLGAPLDTAYGTFLLDVAASLIFALLAVVLLNLLVGAVTMRASNFVSKEIGVKLRKATFAFILLYGIAQSLSVLPRNPFITFIDRIAGAIAVGIFGLYVIYKLLDSALYYYQIEIAPKTETKMDDILVPVIRKVGVAVLYVVGAILTLRNIGWDPTIIFAGAGVAGLVIAFAAQDTFSNLFSGIFLMIDRPFTEGDEIKLENGDIARVENIGLRTTRLYDPQTHEQITVPNNQLATKRIVNLAGPDLRYWVNVDVGVSYDADPRKVEKVLLAVAAAHPKVLREGEWAPRVRFQKFGESSLDFSLKAPVETYRDRRTVASDLRFMIKDAFQREAIEIPYPQRTIHIKDAESLRRGSS